MARRGRPRYSDASVRDARVIALRDRVTAEVDRALHEDQTRVRIRLRGGKTVDIFVKHAIGSVDRPMSDADLEAKFRGLASPVLAKPQIERLIALCWDVAKLGNVADLARASVPE